MQGRPLTHSLSGWRLLFCSTVVEQLLIIASDPTGWLKYDYAVALQIQANECRLISVGLSIDFTRAGQDKSE